MADGTFNITGNGVDGEGTYTISNGTAEIGLHVVIGEMAQKQEVVIAGDKGAVHSLKTTSLSDHTETELTFTKEGKMCPKIHYYCILFDRNSIKSVRDRSLLYFFSLRIECRISKVNSLLYSRIWVCTYVVDSK